jgi:hypothetical protein
MMRGNPGSGGFATAVSTSQGDLQLQFGDTEDHLFHKLAL